MTDVEKLLKQVDTQRVAEELFELVKIPSPTGQERAMALAFAGRLEAAGAEVEIDETLYDSPNVIGRLKGQRAGQVFQLAGHLDHIPVEHAAPRYEKGIISGRGSADMKNGLAGILEMIRILKSGGCDFAGEILVTAYGRHEAPQGDSQGLLNLIGRGVKGDAALVVEGVEDTAVVMGKGQSIWNLRLRNTEKACHELHYRKKWEDFFAAAQTVGDRLIQESGRLRGMSHDYPRLGPESLFLGQFHYGDFYNRMPECCTWQGTRRWHPDKTFEQVKVEFVQLLGGIALPTGYALEHDWIFVGESYAIAEEERIIHALIRGVKHVTGRAIGIGGTSTVTDACRLVRYGGVPTAVLRFGNTTGHSDHEYIEVEGLATACKIGLYTILDYLGSRESQRKR